MNPPEQAARPVPLVHLRQPFSLTALRHIRNGQTIFMVSTSGVQIAAK